MKTTNLFKAVAFVAMVIVSIMNSEVKAQDRFITNEEVQNDLIVAKTIFKQSGTYLYNHMRYEFTYDDENRLTNKTASKWDGVKEILGIVAKEVKTRKDAIAEYEQANREDLIEKANEEIKALEEYLPKQLTDEELVAEVKKVIEKLNATSMKDMGPVMKEAKATIGAQADGKRINEVVKSLLA